MAQTIDTFRFMAGALRAPTSAAAGRYAEDHLSVILREPLGVIGVVTPWNYPLLMARLEDGAHPGRRQHPGPQAVGADPAHHAEVRRTRGRHPAGRRAQRRDRLRPGGRRPARRAPRHRHDRAHRFGPQRQGGGPAPRPSRSSASTSSSAARPRWSSSRTPTWPPRRPRCARPATGTPARSAAPPAACWCTSRWPTSSSSTSSTRSPRWSSASPAPATTSRSGR